MSNFLKKLAPPIAALLLGTGCNTTGKAECDTARTDIATISEGISSAASSVGSAQGEGTNVCDGLSDLEKEWDKGLKMEIDVFINPEARKNAGRCKKRKVYGYPDIKGVAQCTKSVMTAPDQAQMDCVHGKILKTLGCEDARKFYRDHIHATSAYVDCLEGR
jgi:hypothetical protein